MKRLLLTLALLATLARPTAAQSIVDVQSTNGLTITSQNVTLSNIPTGGCIVAALAQYDWNLNIGTFSLTVTDNKSNTYTNRTAQAFNANSQKLWTYTSCGVTGGTSVTVTATYSGATRASTLMVWGLSATTYESATAATTVSGWSANADPSWVGPLTAAPSASALQIAGVACNNGDVFGTNGTDTNVTGSNGFTAAMNTASRTYHANAPILTGYRATTTATRVEWNTNSSRGCFGWTAAFTGGASSGASFPALFLAP